MKKLFTISVLLFLFTVTLKSQSTWKGYVRSTDDNRVLIDENCDIIQDGIIYIAPSLSGINPYWVVYDYDSDFCLSADSAIVEVCFRRGQIDAYDSKISLFGDNATAELNLMGSSWAKQYNFISAGSLKYSSLTQLVQPMRAAGWDTMSIKLQNGQISAIYNSNVIYQMDYTDTLGMMKGISLLFKGSGAVDWVKVYNSSDSTLRFFEDFDSCTKFAEPIIPLPSAAFTFVEQGQQYEVHFESEDQSGTHQWIFPGDETSSLTSPVFVFDSAGTWSVLHIVSTECGADTAYQEIVLIDIYAGVNTAPGLSLSLFPNPGSGSFYLQGIAQKSMDFRVRVFNATGQCLKSENFQLEGSFTQQIIMEEYASGIYNVLIEGGGSRVSKLWMKN